MVSQKHSLDLCSWRLLTFGAWPRTNLVEWVYIFIIWWQLHILYVQGGTWVSLVFYYSVLHFGIEFPPPRVTLPLSYHLLSVCFSHLHTFKACWGFPAKLLWLCFLEHSYILYINVYICIFITLSEIIIFWHVFLKDKLALWSNFVLCCIFWCPGL